MDTKPKVSAGGTYVFDAEDIEQLDELSLTSVLRSVVDSGEHEAPEQKAPDIATPCAAGDTTINEILRAESASNDQPPEQPRFPTDPSPGPTAGDLIDPDLVFPELTSGRRQ